MMELHQAREALRKIAPEQKPRGKSEIKSRIEETTGAAKNPEKESPLSCHSF